MEEDAHLFIQIRNSIDSTVLGLVNHCEFVKELMDYLELCFLEKGMFLVYLMCVEHYIDQRNRISHSQNFL